MLTNHYGIEVKINPAKLDTPITLKKVSGTSVNSANEETVTYTDIDIMSSFQMLSGREGGESGRETTFLRARCIIRYYPGLTTKDYIEYDGDSWDIETEGEYGKKGMFHLLYLRKSE